MGWSDWELSARLVGIPFIPLIVKKRGDNTTMWFYSYSAFGLLPILLLTLPVAPENGNFPWGWLVVPD